MVAVGEVLVHVWITLLQLWFKVWLFLSVWCAEYNPPPEVVIPLRVNDTNGNSRPKGWLSYNLHFGGQRHIIYMKLKPFLISQDFSLFTHSDQGNLLEDQPFVQSGCYYLGFVEGDPESMVALNTCLGGFRGTLLINDTAYEIKPKSFSSTFEHLVYMMGREKTEIPPTRCGLTEEEIARQLKLQESNKSTLRQNDYGTWWTHRWHIELVLIVDYERFIYRGRNTSLVMQDIFIIMNEINFLFFPVDINVVLVGLQIWNHGNPMEMKEIYNLLPEFCKWKHVYLDFHRPHDIAHLFVHHNFTDYFGIAYVGTVCNPVFSCGVDSLLGEDFFGFGQIVAHEIGHNLGMPHDRRFCTCGTGPCVMALTGKGSRKFSNCSYDVLWTTVARTSCMYTAPNPLNIFIWKFCGNGVVDQGEECDCGSSRLCEDDPCCLPGCSLKSGAQCAFGLCCHECLILPPGTLCRPQNNECDLPEWCNGTSHECPEDVFVLDGSPCKSNGYCYEKRCNSHDEQCRTIFGKEARSASENCYREFNTRGDRFGNCGMVNNTYVKCSSSDILCGRVQCEQVEQVPFLRSHYTVYWSYFNDVTCWGTDYHFGMALPDLGDVKDGTGCGLEQVCIHRKCVDKSIWTSQCSTKTCSRKGICNNKHHCHCSPGWDPPHCLVEGSGGSIDSGPSPVSRKERKKPRVKNLILPFWIIFLILFFCLLFCIYKKAKPSHEKEESKVSTSTDVE